ncbi:MAG TPA: copper homeostasis protein CutC [Burkholderiales bacterium]|nr:copper homeostasis protein CutC [Burkholderiales bacterium]
MLIEIIVTNVLEAVTAQNFGANRLELIQSFEYGGLSPNLELAKEVCDAVTIPTNIMIRPQGQNFIYNKKGQTQILSELDYIRDNTSANGIVFGALDNNHNIDFKLLEKVIDNKNHLQLTFHRAIDESKDIINSYKELLNYLDINLVLTSGGKETAILGAKTIKQMLELNQDKINCKILAASGITPENVSSLIKQTGVKQIHLGKGVRVNNILNKQEFEKLLKNLSS